MGQGFFLAALGGQTQGSPPGDLLKKKTLTLPGAPGNVFFVVQYQLYLSGVNATANITLTGRGKINAIKIDSMGTGGAGIGHNALVLTRNTVPTVAANVQINGPQKQANLAMSYFASPNAGAFNESKVVEGIAIEYNSGDIIYMGNFSINGTNPATWFANVTLYCSE